MRDKFKFVYFYLLLKNFSSELESNNVCIRFIVVYLYVSSFYSFRYISNEKILRCLLYFLGPFMGMLYGVYKGNKLWLHEQRQRELSMWFYHVIYELEVTLCQTSFHVNFMDFRTDFITIIQRHSFLWPIL